MLYKLRTAIFQIFLLALLDIANSETQPVPPSFQQEEYCPEEAVDTKDYGTFVFPASQAGVVVRALCPLGYQSNGIQPIDMDGDSWVDNQVAESGVTRECSRDTVNGKISVLWEPATLSESHVQNCRSRRQDSYIKLLTAEVEAITLSTIRGIHPILNNLQHCALQDYGCAEAYVNAIASLLSSPKLNGEDGLTTKDRNLLFKKTSQFIVDVSNALGPGFKFQVGNAGISFDTAKFQRTQYNTHSRAKNPSSYRTMISTSEEDVDGVRIAIGVSAEAVQRSIDQSEGDPVLKIIFYSDDILRIEQEESSNLTMNTNKIPPYDEVSGHTDVGAANFPSRSLIIESDDSEHDSNYSFWGFMSIDLLGVQIENLHEPVQFAISNLHAPEGYKYTCVYWDREEGNWSTKGMSSNSLDDGVACTTTHLTAFSALIEPLPLPFPGAEYAPVNKSIHNYILQILSSVGSVCSIVGLSLTLLTYSLFRSLRRERSNRILINLSASLLLMHIMSLSASKSLWDGRCLVPAASLHYLVLTSLTWMMTEAVNMYQLLISVFVRPENRFMIKRFILAWGIPLIVVAVSVIVETDVYKVGRFDLCLMSAHANIVLYYVAYIAPICIMLLLNLVVFGRIFRVLIQQTKRTKEAKRRHDGEAPKYFLTKISPSQIKGATTVLVLLGVTWIVGLVAIGPFEVFFRYVYCVLNAGQGLFIFLFRVLLNPHACKQWKKVLLGVSHDSSMDTSVSSSTFAGGRRMKRKSTIVTPTFISASNSVENSLTASNPLSATLAATLASILQSEKENGTLQTNNNLPNNI